MPLSLLVPRRERTPRTFIAPCAPEPAGRSEEHTSELQSRSDLVCRLLLEKKKKNTKLRRRSDNNTDCTLRKMIVAYAPLLLEEVYMNRSALQVVMTLWVHLARQRKLLDSA